LLVGEGAQEDGFILSKSFVARSVGEDKVIHNIPNNGGMSSFKDSLNSSYKDLKPGIRERTSTCDFRTDTDTLDQSDLSGLTDSGSLGNRGSDGFIISRSLGWFSDKGKESWVRFQTRG